MFFDDRGYDDSVGGYVLGLVVPVRKGAEIIGILKCNLNILGSISELVSGAEDNLIGKFKLTRSGGMVVFEEGFEPLSTQIHDSIFKKLKSKNSEAFIINDSGEKYIVGCSEIQLTKGEKGYGFGGTFESIDHKKGNTGESWYVLCYRQMNVVLAPITESIKSLILMGFAIILILVLVSYLFGRKIAKPLAIVNKATEKIGKGDFEYRIDVRRKDEFGDLAHSFNSMAGKLQQTTTSVALLENEVKHRKQIEKDLRQSEEKLNTLLNATTDVAGLAEADGTIIAANDAFAKSLGRKKEELIGKSMFEFLSAEVAERRKAVLQGIVASKKPLQWEDEHAGRYFDNSVYPILDDNGSVKQIAMFAKDTTKRVQAENKLREREAQLRQIIDLVPHFIFVKDETGKFKIVNKATAEVFGTTVEDLTGRRDSEFVATEEEMEHFRSDDLEVIRSGKTKFIPEEPITDSEKNIRYLQTTKVPFKISGSGKAALLGVAVDITNMKLAEEALRESEERFRTVADFAYDWEFWIAPDGRYLYVSPSCERITGYSPEEFVNDPGLLEKVVHPDDHSTVVKHLGEEQGLEKLPPRDFRIITRKGEERWINHVCQAVYGADGAYLGRRGSNRDISKQKLMQEELLKAKKLESVGVLAGGIAHDFNNLMSAVVGNISLARIEMKPGSKGFKNLVEAEKASIQTKALTARLITFSEGGGPVKETVSIADLVKDSVGSSLKGSDIDAGFSIPDDISPVEVDEEQMKQAILNIITNAQEAMTGQGTISVSCENVNIGEKDALTLKDGKYVKISIEDQGPGIPEEDLIKIFDPYFSTKDMGTQKGMGLGLAISDSIIKQHDGLITVKSELGTGTIFSIYLPAASAKREEPGAEPPLAESEEVDSQYSIVNIQYSIKRVLVMDDEELVRDVSNALLTHIGYKVEVAVEGIEAIEMYEQAMESEKPFDVVILDLTNKVGIGGAETIVKLLEIDPDVKAIVATGYSGDPIISNFREHGFRGALPKPFTLDQLRTALQDAIAGE